HGWRKMREVLAANSRIAEEHCSKQDHKLGDDLLAETFKGINTDNHDDARKARYRAGNFQRGDRFMARDQPGNQKDENRRGGVEDGGEAAVDILLAPGDHRPGTETGEEGLDDQIPPGPGAMRKPDAL